MKFNGTAKRALATIGILVSANAFAQNRPPLQNVQIAQGKVATINAHVNRIVNRGQGGGGGHGGGGGDWCAQFRTPEQCPVRACTWRGHGRIGRCEAARHGGRHHFHPVNYGHNENDAAALIAMQVMTIGMNALSNDLNNAAASYWTPQFFHWHNQVCDRSGRLIAANQGAKVAAAIPPSINIQPGEFDFIDQELIQVRQLMWCR